MSLPGSGTSEIKKEVKAHGACQGTDQPAEMDFHVAKAVDTLFAILQRISEDAEDPCLVV